MNQYFQGFRKDSAEQMMLDVYKQGLEVTDSWAKGNVLLSTVPATARK